MMIIKKINNNKNCVAQFSTCSPSYTRLDKKNRLIQQKIDNINQQLADLHEEKENLKSDLTDITTSVKAASDISCGVIPSIEDDKTFWRIKDDYASWFDSEGEEQGATSYLNRLLAVRRYIRQELQANKTRTAKLNEEANLLASGPKRDEEPSSSTHLADTGESSSRSSTMLERGGSSSILGTILERGESSRRPGTILERGESSRRPGTILERGESSRRPDTMVEESSKRKADDISDSDVSSVSSKKSRQTPGDYIDSLPELPYNPFDDMWND